MFLFPFYQRWEKSFSVSQVCEGKRPAESNRRLFHCQRFTAVEDWQKEKQS